MLTVRERGWSDDPAEVRLPRPLQGERQGTTMRLRLWRRRESTRGPLPLDFHAPRLPDGNEVPLPGYRTYRDILNDPRAATTQALPTVEPGTPVVRPYINATEGIESRRKWWRA